jgi:hypothetical protein
MSRFKGLSDSMSNVASSEKVRAAVGWQLKKLGVRDTGSMHETILIHNGLFCGRRFQCEEFQAVWFLEEDEIKFFGPCGEMLQVSSVEGCVDHLEQRTAVDGDRRAA